MSMKNAITAIACIATPILACDANALIVSGTYSGIVTFAEAPPPIGAAPGSEFDGEFSFNTALIPSTGGTYTGPWFGSIFAFSFNGASYDTNLPVSFTAGSGGVAFSTGFGAFGSGSLSLAIDIPLSLFTNVGTYSLTGDDIGSGQQICKCGFTNFDINSVSITSSEYPSAVPLPPSLSMFATALAGTLGFAAYFRRHRNFA